MSLPEQQTRAATTNAGQGTGFDTRALLEWTTKIGVPGVIALYLVWSMATRQENAMQRLNSSVDALNVRIERLAERLDKR